MTQILIVEDDFDTRTLIVELLEMEGYAVHGVGTGDEAISFINSHPLPKYILLDISIPGIPTVEIMNVLNSREDRKDSKVLLASGWDDLHIKSKEMGADGFIKKPLDVDTLLKIFV